jgi:hypothetical protein
MKIIKIKMGQETPLVWCGGEGVKNVVEKGLKLKGVDDEDVSSALWYRTNACRAPFIPFLADIH